MKLNLKTTGLVLEGGGMRGVFTSGVLDAFMKHDVYFPYTVAVSAGACNGMSYMSRQPRRARIMDHHEIFDSIDAVCIFADLHLSQIIIDHISCCQQKPWLNQLF